MKVEDLDVVKLSHELTLQVYRETGKFPKEEKYGMISQMRRAAASVSMNLMEGGHRFSRNEYKYFVSIARGSSGEIKYQLMLGRDLGYIKEERCPELRKQYEKVSMMLTKLHKSL